MIRIDPHCSLAPSFTKDEEETFEQWGKSQLYADYIQSLWIDVFDRVNYKNCLSIMYFMFTSDFKLTSAVPHGQLFYRFPQPVDRPGLVPEAL